MSEPTNHDAEAALDLAAVREELAAARGRHYWRSLEELARRPGFEAMLTRELPRQAAHLLDAVDRRQFLQLMGASLALAGVSACTRQPTELIMPYVKAPEEIVPGRPLFFATAMPLGGVGTGLLVESHMGRPTKVEGNPEHPSSRGATSAFAQASILGLYDPDRSQTVTSAGEIRTWDAFAAALEKALEPEQGKGGAGLRILTETISSPTLAAQLQALRTAYPQARWHQWDPVASDGARLGARMAFGEDADVQYQFAAADVVLALDADVLASGRDHVRHLRDFAGRRKPGPGMNRLYAVESTPTPTGARADHRLAVRGSDVEAIAWALAAALGAVPQAPEGAAAAHAAWVQAVAKDLGAHRGSGIVVAGDHQPPVVHALAHAMNAALGNAGKTVVYTDPVIAEPVATLASLRDLVADMDAGKVAVLLILGSNPVATAPVDLRFAERLEKVPFRAHLGLYEDETAEISHWHVPEAHYLESWSDVRAADGTVTIVQPLIAPLYDGRTAHEVIAVAAGKPQSPFDLVRAEWKPKAGADFERWWRTALHDGMIAGTALPPKTPALRTDWVGTALTEHAKIEEAKGLEVVFRLDAGVLDGRFANNGWLQEVPKPLTKLTWDNAALVSPATAKRLGVVSGDVVEIAVGDGAVDMPVWVLPGQPDESVTLNLGYGRRRAGRVGDGVGVDVTPIRTSAAAWIALGAGVRRTSTRYLLASTQEHDRMEGRHLIREATLAEYVHEPEFAQHVEHQPGDDMNLYPPYPYEGSAWGMTIDLATCVGCNACILACNAENNIPVVGKDQVSRGREMHWLRIDRYFEGEAESPTIHHQPVLCMQCEQAPCEVVCPVNATVHSSEGLNDMVYNRCVGTKYCSNNCPYKVRRFNFYKYQDWTTESLKLARNPDVTVRAYGVMEKCTYCVQRISQARIAARREDRPVRDGEVVTACAQACPADAIVFGDINDRESRVAKTKADARNYALLGELNTRPRTTYLASVRNPNPELEKA
ncbi:MAG: molybdopterin oxidoreductase [Polyangiaceae bacterium UTPRO1]|jgi:molybdopterin-containing oxidoreductase family iron-sulfur binding subunit|nr:TAT-variant-translocated molybdopterin oxidoreductase [Myxococcales bacterium]OQY65727.1 MAG: molybdopterin oxidoreductase [Polyangiaceae bacterium UTPRO1]